MRALEAGSLVCFYTSLGELVTVKQEHKTWELHACLAPSPPNAEGERHQRQPSIYTLLSTPSSLRQMQACVCRQLSTPILPC